MFKKLNFYLIIIKNHKRRYNKLKYTDITVNILGHPKKQFKIIEQLFFINSDGTRYDVDNKYILFKTTEREKEVANLIGTIYGGEVRLIPVVLSPQNIETPDYIINGEKYDLKEIHGNGKNTLDTAISKKRNQSNNFIFDITQTEMTEKEAIHQINKIYDSKHRQWVDKIVLLKNTNVLKIYKRKK